MDLLRSLPIGLYLEHPITWLHRLDPRVKLVWLLSFLITPVISNSLWRIILALLAIAITLTAGIPFRALRQQAGWLLIVCTISFIVTCFVNDGLAVSSQPRVPDSLAFFPETSYQYILLQIGRFKVTRHSLDLAVRLSTILFVLIYSSSLYLLTTAPEEITAGLEDLMQPLRRLKIPVTEIALTLTLSLRFIPLVLEEIQNLFRSVTTRAINWKKLGLRQSFNLWLIVAERLLENLLMRAEQIAIAMEVRGFTSPDRHRVQWHQLRLGIGDGVALGILVLFWWARLVWGWAA
ncbi:energy-coupling factor transporter transmembrane component T family protein [Spirulina sp. 06S082]|uniref:energy-coupling factor transporter transmembrane component T family protein n=1 Tax=Spirulina sp. 06S082 TaxID=3110248 RepID=UPI002B204C95|nr:CbiQ family ECF transporter T component [Spirulina sp. 06S082]MEA5468167.1 CbiQ family ECF transporter T component [Spirulina sp. 06S082]